MLAPQGKLQLCNLDSPESFNSFLACSEKRFSNQVIEWPRGIQTTGQITSGADVLEAPYPVVSSSFPSQILPSCFDSFICGNGISFFSSRPKHRVLSGVDLGLAIGAEFKEFSLAKTPKARSEVRHGPKMSMKPRGVSISLMLPNCVPGKQHANKSSMALLNAFSLIASSPLTSKRGNRKSSQSGTDVEKAFVDAASVNVNDAVPKTTSHTRLAVLSKIEDVAALLSFFRVNTTDGNWQKQPSLLICYATGDADIPIKCDNAPINFGSDNKLSIVDALEAIHDACSKARMQAQIDCFTFAPAFLTQSAVHGIEGCAENAFLHFQQALQIKFKELHVSTPICEIELAERSKFSLQNNSGVWLRICAAGMPWRADDGAHNVGMLFATHASLLETYIARCALEAQSQQGQLMNVEVVFKLLEPDLEEMKAAMCVMWVKYENAYVGNKISLFAPRAKDLIGTDVCEHPGCVVNRVVPILSKVETLLCQNLIIPVEPSSVMPRASHFSKSLALAFSNVFESSRKEFAQVLSSCAGSSSMSASDASTFSLCGTGEGDSGEVEAFYSALFCSRLGHPCMTVGNAIDVMMTHQADTRMDAAVFNSLLQTAATIFGINMGMHELMKKCENGLLREQNKSDQECESPRKRIRSSEDVEQGGVPAAAAPAPAAAPLAAAPLAAPPAAPAAAPPAAEAPSSVDSFSNMIQNPKNHNKFLAMCGLSHYSNSDEESGELEVDFDLVADGEDFGFLRIASFIIQALGNSLHDENISDVIESAVSMETTMKNYNRGHSSVGKTVLQICAACLAYNASCSVVVIDSTNKFKNNEIAYFHKDNCNKFDKIGVADILETRRASPAPPLLLVWANSESCKQPTKITCFS
jgi:hypothetical protein